MSEYKYTSELRYDFKTEEKAKISANSLMADDDLKPEEDISTFEADGRFLVFKSKAISPKFLKKAITTTIPSIELVEQTINEFAID
jgi:hypothetical protein